MSLKWDPKDPDEVVDYQVDWSARLDEGDAIASSTWSVSVGAGLVIASNTFSDTTTTVWLSAGDAGVNYTLLNRVTTSGGRTFDQSVKLRIKEK